MTNINIIYLKPETCRQVYLPHQKLTKKCLATIYTKEKRAKHTNDNDMYLTIRITNVTKKLKTLSVDVFYILFECKFLLFFCFEQERHGSYKKLKKPKLVCSFAINMTGCHLRSWECQKFRQTTEAESISSNSCGTILSGRCVWRPNCEAPEV